MTEENKDVIEEVTEETSEQPIEEAIEQTIEESKFKSAGDDSVVKVDLDKPPVKMEKEKAEEPKVEEPKAEEQVKENVEEVKEEQPVIEEVTEESEQPQEVTEEEKTEEVVKPEAEVKLPEHIQKVVDFMEETGGDLQDYVNLNKDISKLNDSEVLDEYYRTTKSHLTPEERSFLMEDSFGIDEE